MYGPQGPVLFAVCAHFIAPDAGIKVRIFSTRVSLLWLILARLEVPRAVAVGFPRCVCASWSRQRLIQLESRSVIGR